VFIEAITEMKIKNLKNEIDTWVRALNYIQEENIFLKNRLSEIIKNDVSEAALEQFEYFQNQLINKDTITGLLRHDIADHCRSLEDPEQQSVNFSIILNKQDHFRKDINTMEKDFNKLKVEFNRYLAQVA